MNAWADVLRRRDTAGLRELLAGCPACPERDAAAADAAGHDDLTLFSLVGLAQTLLTSAGPVHAALTHDIAEATGGAIRDASVVSAQLLTVAEWAAEIETGSSVALGAGDAALAEVAQWLPWLEAHGSRTKTGVLALTAAEVHLDRGRPEAAVDWLAIAGDAPVEHFAIPARRELVRRRLVAALQNPTELPAPYQGPAGGTVADFAAQLTLLRGQLSNLAPGRRARAAAILDQMEAGLAQDPPDIFAGGAQLQAEFLAAFGRDVAPGSIEDVQARFQEAVTFLQDPVQSRDPVALGEFIAGAERLRSDAQVLGLVSEPNVLDWAIAVARRRRGEDDAAADVLGRLWADLETQRAAITDPMTRAGVFAAFPYLFVTLAGALYQAGRQHDLLDAIEAGKGRLLEDLLTRDALASPPSTEPLPKPLPEPLTQPSTRTLALPAGSHLLSFLVDDDCVFAVLLTTSGSRYAQRIELARPVLRSYAAAVDPSTWGRSLGGFGRRVPADLPDRLAPLVSWLEPLLATGVLHPGDHLCYSPDDELFLIPLHLLTMAGRPLLQTFSVSRLHAARALADLLGRPPSRPRAAFALDVPAAEDDPGKAAGFRRTGDRLAGLLPTERSSRTQATIAALAAGELTHRVVHFTTHGTFPKGQNPDADQNPYRSSGLVLATEAGLPSLIEVAQSRAGAGLLSPARLSSFTFTGSHVTTQACSTGLAREGAGGDALGIELAFLLAGADSVLTTHWDVPLTSSSEFCERFYQGWLGPDALSRAQAWRRAALSMKDEGRPPHEWAAFSLAGDWR